jgi:4-amino-4-deoxychorismate lyase
MVIINGVKQHRIEVADRGYQYGDGLFETIEVEQGKAVFIQQHLARMKSGSHRLQIPFPDEELLNEEISSLVCDVPHAILKLILTRGVGGRGYRQPEIIHPTRVLSLHSFPEYPSTLKKQGIKARICQCRLGLNPFLAGIKHLNRLEQVLARSEWRDPDIHEGLMLDLNDNVIEGTMSNFFLVKNNQLYTPKLDYSGVEGIMRNVVLQLAKKFGLDTALKQLTQQDVFSADELFVTNSVIGLWPIKKVEQYSFGVGPVTRHIQSWVDDYKKLDRT